MRYRNLLCLFACFLLASPAFSLVITEIMYNQPSSAEDPEGTSENLEFIEIYNDRAGPEDLSGYKFTQGIHYVFSNAYQGNGRPVASMAGGTYLVLAKDAAAFEAKYGFAPFGQYHGSLSNSGDRIVLENDAGDPYDPETNTQDRREGARIISFSYDDDGRWPIACDGAGHTLCLIDIFGDQSDPDNWTISPQRWGTPGADNGLGGDWLEATLVAGSSPWRYRKGTSAPPSNWDEASYNDNGWLAGQTPIGYGEGEVVTALSDMQGGYVSFYARKTFPVNDPSAISRLLLDIDYDDGYVAYLNGTEIARDNLDGTPPPHTEEADSHESGSWVSTDISSFKNLLTPDNNVLAIQVHNTSLNSTDSLLNARLVAHYPLSSSSLVINEVYFNSNSGAGHFVEIYNTSASAVDLSQYYLSSRPSSLNAVNLSGTLAGHGYLAIEEEEDLPLALEYQDPPPPEGEIDYGTLRLFLSKIEDGDPNNAFVVAAENFSGRLPTNFSMARIDDGGETWYRTSMPTEAASNALGDFDINTDIVINEIMYNHLKLDDPFTTDDDGLYGKDMEYVEIFNRGSTTVDLSAWRFSRGVNYIFPAGARISAGQYLVIARNPTRIMDVYGLASNTVLGPFSGSLDNNGEKVRLRNDKNNVVDEVRYHDGGTWDSWADGMGGSLELIDPDQENDFGGAWQASDDRDKAEWTTIAYSGVHQEFNPPLSDSELHMYIMGEGEILLDELQFSNSPSFTTNYLPSGSGDFDQSSDFTNNWIKSNDQGGTHDESHWTDEDSFEGGGCLKIVAQGRGDAGYNRLECNTQALSKRTYYVRYMAKWIRGANLLMTRTCGHGVANLARIPVPDNLGTPGAQNSVYRANQGPVYKGLNQYPVVPNGGEAVTVTATIRDSDGISGARIRYKRDISSSFSQAVMNDDGTDGDAVAGDHVWTGIIPGQTANSVIEFYVEATDNAAQTTQHPPLLPANPYPNALESLAIYRVGDRRSVGSKALYRITVTRDGLNALNQRRTLSNKLVPCSFVLNEKKIFYGCGQRFRGSPWIRGTGTGISGSAWNGIRINFPKDDKLFGRYNEINLDASGHTNQHDRTAYYFERKMVAATPGAYGCWSWGRYVDVRYLAGTNGTTRNTVYDHIQKVDGDYLDYWWRGKGQGPLHKVDDWFEFGDSNNRGQVDVGLIYMGNNKEAYRNYYELRAGFEIHDDFDHLINLCYGLQHWSTTYLDAHIHELMDMPQWTSILIARRFIDDWDTIGGHRSKNAYIYRPSPELVLSDPNNPDSPLVLSNETWKLVPWDSDLTFSNQSRDIYIDDAGLFPNLNKLYSRPWAKRQFNTGYRYFLDNVVTSQRLSAWLNWVASSAGVGGTDLNSWCQGRANIVNQRIPRDGSTPFQVTTPSSSPHITQDITIDIRGTAPGTVDIITLNGQDITSEILWRNSTATQWQYTAMLAEGENELTFAGYQRNNYEMDNERLIDTDTIIITSTNEVPPEISSVNPREAFSTGGETITIRGSNFQAPVTVLFGDVEADDVNVVNTTELRVAAPPHSGGNVTITVSSRGFSDTYQPFTYIEINEDFRIAVGNAAVNLNSTCTVPVMLNFNHDPDNTNGGDIQGWSYGICHDPVFVQPIEISMGGDTAGLKNGAGPDYFLAVLPDDIAGGDKDGIVIGVIPDYMMAANIIPANNWHDITITYLADCQVCTGLGTTIDTLATPCNTLGDPEVESFMTVNNNAIHMASYRQGTITIDPTQSGETFLRGDTNLDTKVDLADAIAILDYLFGEGGTPEIKDAADPNDDGDINLADAIYILDYLFGEGDDPMPPFPNPGTDPTADDL